MREGNIQQIFTAYQTVGNEHLLDKSEECMGEFQREIKLVHRNNVSKVIANKLQRHSSVVQMQQR